MKNTTVFDADLNPILETANNEDLGVLVDYLNGKLSCMLSIEDAYKAHHPDHTKYADLIAKEIRDMGGNSFANLFRGFEGPAYHEIVCDVAKKLKAPHNNKQEIQDIERSIFETILTTALDSMTQEEKEELLKEMGGKHNFRGIGAISTATFITIFRSGGFYSYQLTVIIANQIARFILGRGLTFAANATLTRIAAIVTGPIGLALTGLWTAIDLAGPAFKVTIPIVIQVALIRMKASAKSCSNCDSSITDPTAKFCPECGSKMQ